MTDNYLEAEELLRLARAHTDTGDERDQALAALFAARAQAHATLALATRPTEQTEPETVPLSDAYAAWGDCIVRGRNGDLVQIGDRCHIWLVACHQPVSCPNVYSTSPNRRAPVTLVERLAPWPDERAKPTPGPVLCGCREQREATDDPEGCYCSCADNPDAGPCDHEAVPLWRAAETWGDDIEVQSLRNPDTRWRVRGGKYRSVSWDEWHDVTEKNDAMVILVSREPYRDDPVGARSGHVATPEQIRAAGIEVPS